VAFVAAAVVGSQVVGGYLNRKSAGKASDAQAQAADAGIEEQRRQFDAIQELLAPYVESGVSSLGAQQDLIGLGGSVAQQDAINQLQESPQYQALLRSGEEAILQNASATGGLRGGNVQSALAQYRPELLGQLIESQFSKLGQLTNIGQASATGQASAGQASANNISNLLAERGKAVAGGEIAQAEILSDTIGSIGGGLLGRRF